MASHLSQISCGLVMAAVGIGMLLVGCKVERVECDRPGDLCRISTDYRLYTKVDELRVRDIASHQYVARSKGRGQTVLVDRAGHEHVVGFTFEADARARYDALFAFLTGDAPRVEVVTGPWAAAKWTGALFLVVLAPLGFAFGWGRRRR